MTRADDEASSFDLFLDTICNTFGGIVFLAILLALMIQTRSISKTEESTDETRPTADEIRSLIQQLDSLTAAHAALIETLAETPDVSDGMESQEYIDLVALVSRTEAEIATVTQQHAHVSRELAQRLAENAALQAENERLPEELADTQKELVKQQAEYVRTADSKQQTLRLPRSRSTSAASYLVLCQGEQLYLALRPSLYGMDFETGQVTTKSVGTGGTEIRPVQGTGWSMGDAIGMQHIEQLIASASRQRFIITIAIWPDSYASFADLRERMIDAGVPYQLWLQDEGAVLTVVKGSGTSKIQ